MSKTRQLQSSRVQGPLPATGGGPNGASRFVLGMRVDATTYADATEGVLAWARAAESHYVCVATVHMVMEAHDDPGFREVINAADLVTSDGMPLVWALRWLGVRGAQRVYGPRLTPLICERAAREGVPVGFYGGTEDVLDAVARRLGQDYPGLRVAYRHAPPFRPLTAEEDEEVVRDIHASGARILFVGLGCPKQERWMAAHRDRINMPMLGVGAAFDFLAGHKPQAPALLQRAGLEWSYRLLHEPRRLWRRYVYHNPRFVALFAAQLLGLRFPGSHG